MPGKKRAKRLELPDPEIGRRFAVAREAAGLTQVELAARLEIHQSQISKFETGERGMETKHLLRLLTIASEAGIRVEEFVLKGQGSALHGDQVIVSDATLVDDVIDLARRLELQKKRQRSGTPDKPPAPSDKGNKP